jgi:glucosamine-6-phosphate deaminase
VALTVVEDEKALYNEFARQMVEMLEANNRQGRETKWIVPVGPVGQWPVLADLCNARGVSCRDLVLFNMDEYLTDDDEYLPLDDPLSFRGIMRRLFHDRLEPELRVPEEHRFFPDPTDLDSFGHAIEKFGGIDAVFGGIGIAGHIAFNEPPGPGEEAGVEEFAARPTRCLSLNWETSVINSVSACRGNIDRIPRRCATVGMKEILTAARLRFFCFQRWQSAVVRKALHGPVTPRCPASYLQRHPDAALIITQDVAQLPEPAA